MQAFIAMVVFAVSYFWAWRGVVRCVRLCKGNSVAGHIAGAFLGLIPALFGSIGLAVILENPTQWGRVCFVAVFVFGVFWLYWFEFRKFGAPVSVDLVPHNPLSAEPESAVPVADSLPILAKRASPAGGLIDVVSSAPSLPGIFEFEYTDADGVITSREVRIFLAESSGSRYYFKGFCLSRKAERTFRVESIIGKMVEVSSGKRINADTLFRSANVTPIAKLNAASFNKPKAARSPARAWETAVFFAGFSAAKKIELEMLADEAGWQVRATITKTVDYAVFGSMAGGSQMLKIQNMGISLIDEDDFRALL